MIIGICGGSGSGKTTLLKKLSSEFNAYNPCIFSMDDYYLPLAAQQKDQNGIYNFDLPSALDKQKMLSDLHTLIAGQPIRVKEYHFNAPPDFTSYKTLEPSDLLIVEGLFLFEYVEIRNLLDFSIFIEIDEEIQLERRLQRDISTRGYTKEAILYQWNNHVLPCYKHYLQPYIPLADFIYHSDHTSEFDDATLGSLLRKQLTEKAMK